ncbi:MAG: ATP-binding cassette domain-containing protein [Spirochaetales bacterium]|nr:ATP-binding cassette domain-containing protein [Spirochaetales bacterium]
MNEHILDIRRLKKYYPVKGGVFKKHIADVKAVDDLDLTIRKGECLGLVGESGCGKTTLGKTILRLHEATEGRIYYNQSAEEVDRIEGLLDSGDKTKIAEARQLLQQVDLTKMSGKDLLKLRRKIQIVFQDPSNSLNPRMLVKKIIAEPLYVQGVYSAREIEERVLNLLNTVGMAKEHMMRYPHEFSGGQRQRIAVARALATNPDFVLMDEPTSALDVSVQSQILNLLMQLQKDFSLTYLFVTHHLLVVKYISNRIAVMYLGKMVELGATAGIFKNPLHPYTKALLSAIPIPDPASERQRIILTGDVPNPINPPKGCRFHPRCSWAVDRCREEIPVLEEAEKEHFVACHRWKEIS